MESLDEWVELSRASNKVVMTKCERCVGDPRGQWLCRTASSSCSSEVEVGVMVAGVVDVGEKRWSPQ